MSKRNVSFQTGLNPFEITTSLSLSTLHSSAVLFSSPSALRGDAGTDYCAPHLEWVPLQPHSLSIRTMEWGTVRDWPVRLCEPAMDNTGRSKT